MAILFLDTLTLTPYTRIAHTRSCPRFHLPQNTGLGSCRTVSQRTFYIIANTNELLDLPPAFELGYAVPATAQTRR